MNIPKAASAGCLALLLGAGLLAAPAHAQVYFSINIAPPPAQYEVVPAMPQGYVWAPGYWAWHGNQHIWVRGRSILQRTGYRWEPDRWEERNMRFYRHPGVWAADGPRYNPNDNPRQGKPKKPKKHKSKDDRD
jgi:hypothetical protein